MCNDSEFVAYRYTVVCVNQEAFARWKDTVNQKEKVNDGVFVGQRNTHLACVFCSFRKISASGSRPKDLYPYLTFCNKF